MPRLELRNVALTYPNGTVGLHPMTLAVPDGDALALVGLSGSGKSTLLRLVIGLETPTSGEILLDGRRLNEVPPHQRGVAFVAQKPALYPHLTVRENLELASKKFRIADCGLRISSKVETTIDSSNPQSAIRNPQSLFDEAIALLKIEHLLKRLPTQLSGGEKQRVVLARAVLSQARLWLLDEPFAPLDPVFRSQFREELHLLFQSLRCTIILVSHDPLDALALGRRLGVLGDGRLLQLGTPEELRDQPPHAKTAELLGQYFFRP